MHTLSRQLLASLALAALASSAPAAVTTYSSLAAFQAAVPTYQTDSFDDLLAGDLAGPLSRGSGPAAHTVSAPSGLFGIGSPDLWLSNNDRREGILFADFAGVVSAIGGTFFGTNEAGAALVNQLIMVTITDSASDVSSTLLTLDSVTSFFGVTSTVPIVSMAISVADANLLAAWPTVNNLVVAAVPEPGTLALMLVGIAGVAGLARRRRRAA